MSARAQELKVAQLENDVAAIYSLVSRLERGQRRHDARFARIDERLDGIDGRLGGLTQQVGEVQQGLATVIELVRRRD